jgi:hypothetical protein
VREGGGKGGRRGKKLGSWRLSAQPGKKKQRTPHPLPLPTTPSNAPAWYAAMNSMATTPVILAIVAVAGQEKKGEGWASFSLGRIKKTRAAAVVRPF